MNGPEFQRFTSYSAQGEQVGLTGERRADGVVREAPPQTTGGPGLWQVIAERRSLRRFARTPLSRADLFQMLWATQGITGPHGLRAAPSAGALYPVDTYVVVNRVADMNAGLYRLRPEDTALELLAAGEDIGRRLAEAALGQQFLAEANVGFVWTAVPERATWKYRDRAYRYFYLDAGHLCHALALAATALGCAACGVAAFYDDLMNALVGVDGEREFVVYAAAVGLV